MERFSELGKGLGEFFAATPFIAAGTMTPLDDKLNWGSA